MFRSGCHSLRQFRNYTRGLSTKSALKGEPKYTDTINLPKTKFPARLSAEKRTEVQDRLRKTCFSELYAWQRENLPAEKEFILHDGPPYANGDLHMGHAVNKILKDLILKHKIVSGTKVHYVPGWDCHGLPIELKALEAYGKKHKGAGQRLDPLKVRELARKFALDTIEKQKIEFEQWGVTADWTSRKSWYRTLDVGYISAQLKLFQELFAKGLIYRDVKPVYWSPSSQSALAEAELEYDEAHKSPSLYLKMRLTAGDGCAEIARILQSNERISAIIWTTTPWTLPANQAICYNPSLEYSLVRSETSQELLLIGSELISYVSEQTQTNLEQIAAIPGSELGSIRYRHPINGEELPFLSGEHVKSEKGTGLVHTAPAHGPDDFLVFLDRKIPVRSLIDEAGCYNKQAPDFLRGKFALTDGNQLILERLQNDTMACGVIEHSYPIDWRTKKPVMLRASDQWFINTDRLKESALKAVEQIDIYPHSSADVSKKVLCGQLQKRPYWCISRQRAWGVPIPVVYEKSSTKPVVHPDIIENLCEMLEKTGNVDFWWSTDVAELVPQRVLDELQLTHQDLVKGSDILDIWFDSGISWLSVLGGEQKADLYLEGLDQFTGWFQSSLLTSVAARNESPYRALFVHGFAVDEKGMKMSKSLGNIISPKDIVKQYGCDTLRWWVAAHAIQNVSIPVSHKLLGSSAENLQKIRGIMKYLLGATSEVVDSRIDLSNLTHVDQYFLQQLCLFHDTVFSLYDSYQYNKVSATIVTFCVSTLSGFYVHLIKDRLYCGSDKQFHNLQAILAQTLKVLCKVLWPIAPFLVEESWSYSGREPFFKSSQRLDFTPPPVSNVTPIIEQALNLKRHVFQRNQMDVNTWLLAVDATVSQDTLHLLQRVHPMLNEPQMDSELCEILQVGSLILRETKDGQQHRSVKVDKLDQQLCPRCRRYALHPGSGMTSAHVCQRCKQVLKAKTT
ncbi:isoleucine--tRNA ligase, mitochondrial [Aedes aegypti]|uniref:isoleucine--tRNA ligase n=1 Tax=Aedes aegypti TaxID=7159 RepID=A0A6I8TY02_AEDAE|nr:isoleucine--tRNA ligase, mitochondrial [Aedes aegypti]